MSNKWDNNVPIVISPVVVRCSSTKLTDGEKVGLPEDLAVQCVKAEHNEGNHEAYTVGPNGFIHSRWEDL